jgi:hypothetical protein
MGAPSTVVLGWESDVTINGQDFGVTKGTVSVRAREQECGDTSTGVYEMHKGGRVVMEVNADFYLKPEVPLHINPLLIVPGSYIDIAVFPKGIGLESYAADFFEVYEFRADIDVDGKVTGHLQGKSSGQFSIPTD